MRCLSGFKDYFGRAEGHGAQFVHKRIITERNLHSMKTGFDLFRCNSAVFDQQISQGRANDLWFKDHAMSHPWRRLLHIS